MNTYQDLSFLSDMKRFHPTLQGAPILTSEDMNTGLQFVADAFDFETLYPEQATLIKASYLGIDVMGTYLQDWERRTVLRVTCF